MVAPRRPTGLLCGRFSGRGDPGRSKKRDGLRQLRTRGSPHRIDARPIPHCSSRIWSESCSSGSKEAGSCSSSTRRRLRLNNRLSIEDVVRYVLGWRSPRSAFGRSTHRAELPLWGRKRPDGLPDTSRSAAQTGLMRHWHRRPVRWIVLPALTLKVPTSLLSNMIWPE